MYQDFLIKRKIEKLRDELFRFSRLLMFGVAQGGRKRCAAAVDAYVVSLRPTRPVAPTSH